MDEFHHRHHGEVDRACRSPAPHGRRPSPARCFGRRPPAPRRSRSSVRRPSPRRRCVLPHLRGDEDRRFRPVAFHRDPKGPAGAPRADLRRELLPGCHRYVVDPEHHVPFQEPRAGGRAVGRDVADARGQGRHASEEDDPENEDGEDEVSHRSGRHDRHLHPDRFLLEGARQLFGRDLIPFALPDELHVAAEGNRGEDVFGFTPPEAGQLRSEPERELGDSDTEFPGHDEVAEFVHENEDAEDDDEREEIDHDGRCLL